MAEKSRALKYVEFKRHPGKLPPQIRIDRERFEVRVDGKVVNLSSVQFDIFVMICEADGRVVSRQDMMKKLWGWPKDVLNAIETRTVDQHISRLRRMLSKRPLIQTVPGRGYKLIRY
jgi:DNA-binding response OmpR family regulator